MCQTINRSGRLPLGPDQIIRSYRNKISQSKSCYVSFTGLDDKMYFLHSQCWSLGCFCCPVGLLKQVGKGEIVP